MSNRSAFVLVSAMGQSLIVNRNDYNPMEPTQGVGIELLEHGTHEIGIGTLVAKLAIERKRAYGQGVVIVDAGANIGHLTCFWARIMDGASGAPWGRILAIEPQEWPFYALCGNVALNNCFNAKCVRAALGATAGYCSFPTMHPIVPHNSGGVHMATDNSQPNVELITLDGLKLHRLDILKLDIEGCEPAAIAGGRKTIEKFKPIIIAETLVCGQTALEKAMDGLGYEISAESSINVLCVHKDEINPQLRAALNAVQAANKAA